MCTSPQRHRNALRATGMHTELSYSVMDEPEGSGMDSVGLGLQSTSTHIHPSNSSMKLNQSSFKTPTLRGTYNLIILIRILFLYYTFKNQFLPNFFSFFFFPIYYNEGLSRCIYWLVLQKISSIS